MKSPAFQFYPDDFVGGTIDMTTEDKGAYMMLICYQWGKGSIPKDKNTLNRIAGCVVSDVVLSKFKNGMNPRLEAERLKQQEWREKSRIGGQKSAEKRWGKGGYKMVKECLQPNGQPKGNPPSPSPSPIRQERDASLSSAEIQQVFDEWNKMAAKSGLPQCLLVSDKRRRFLTSRLRDEFFKSNWRSAMSRVGNSPFCRGESERGWRASLDWFITPDAVVKVMEGKYDAVKKEVVQNGY